MARFLTYKDVTSIDSSDADLDFNCRVKDFNHPKYMVLDGKLVDKYNFQPVIGKFDFSSKHPDTRGMILKEKIDVFNSNELFNVKAYASFFCKMEFEDIIYDRFDSSIFYVFEGRFQHPSNKARYAREQIIHKFKKLDNDVIFLGSSNIMSYSYNVWNRAIFDILGETEKYFYFISTIITNSYRDEGKNNCFVFALDKTNLTFTYLAMGPDFGDYYTKIYEGENYSLFALNDCNSKKFYLHTFNKTDRRFTKIANQKVIPTTNFKAGKHICCFHKIDGTTGMVFNSATISESTDGKLHIFKRMVNIGDDFLSDPNSVIVSEEECKITWEEEGMTDWLENVVTSNQYLSYRLFITKTSTNMYLNLLVCTETEDSTNNGQFTGIYTFLINSSFDLEYKSYIELGEGKLRPAIFMKENKELLTCTKSNVYLLEFNELEEKFDLVFDKSFTTINSVGIDTLNRIWVNTADDGVHLLTHDTATDINVTFKNNIVEYDNQDVENAIFVNTTNHLGEKVQSDILLQLEGDVVFADNNNNILEFTTSVEDVDVEIPILIKGTKDIIVNAKIII